jgi:GAF domain-containing protein
MGASDESARLLELFQIQHEEGPCLDCYRSGRPVTVADLTSEPSRWPAFTERALASGVRSVHAFPMRLRDQVIGALNVFGAEPRPLDPEEARVVQALADLATIAIIQERLIRQAELLTEQLQFALNSRVVIEQAKGAIARSLGVSVEEAFDLMRGHARRERVGLTRVRSCCVPVPDRHGFCDIGRGADRRGAACDAGARLSSVDARGAPPPGSARMELRVRPA